MNFQSHGNIKKALIDLLFIMVGTAIYALGLHIFIAPNQIAPGGISGLAIVINYLTNLPIGILQFVLNLPLLIIAIKYLGNDFTIKTLISVLALSANLDYVVAGLPTYVGDPLLSSLFGGAVMGFGLAIVFMRGYTTGGTDIVSRLLQRRFPYMQIGKILFAIDAVIIAISAAVFGQIETALYGMVSVFTSALLMDSVLYGMDRGKVAFIISPKAAEISKEVISQLDRSATIIKSTGAFTNKEGAVLMVAVHRQQYYPLKNIIHDIDPTAFVIVADSSEILGEGFKGIKE